MSGRDGFLATALRIALPVIMAFAAGALILLALGKNPLEYYVFVFQRGLFSWPRLQGTIPRSAPLLLIAAGLIVAFRAGIWNLGVDGQFLLAAVVCSALAPGLIGFLPRWLTLGPLRLAPRGGAGGRELVVNTGASQGALWGQRNHHHLDDVVPGYFFRQCADQT